MNTPAPTAGIDAFVDEDWRRSSVLIVDDEAGMRSFLSRTLERRCGRVAQADSTQSAAALMAQQRFDLLILDNKMPGKHGVAWLQELRHNGFTGEVILITAYADLETAIEALRAGASDFVIKPFRVPQILNAMKQCLARARLTRENFVLRRSFDGQSGPLAELVGDSPVMRALRERLHRIATVDSTVLLYGESGTGKELAARALHSLSPRARGPFVPVNCATLSPELLASELFGHARGAFTGATQARDGLFYYAQGGTLFLDEIAELPLSLQSSLLRVLEDRMIRPVGSEQQMPVDLRVIAATNRRLAEEVAAGRFRADLFYRLQVVEVTMPALRDHAQDISALAQVFIDHFASRMRLPPIAISEAQRGFLCEYAWPGNVRELRNLIERSLILGELNVSALYPRLDELPAPPRAGGEPTNLASLEKQHIRAVLESVGGDKSRAAALLGISRRTLERRFAEWSAGTSASRPE